MTKLPPSVIEEMCQITKENSIEGCKAAQVGQSVREHISSLLTDHCM
jgi:hypothetical protein